METETGPRQSFLIGQIVTVDDKSLIVISEKIRRL